MADSTLLSRTLTHDEFDEFRAVFAAALMFEDDEQHRERSRPLFEPDRAHGVFDGRELIGAGYSLNPAITLPGGRPCPLAAVTAVGVKPGHRRRGVLTMLMRAQLDSLHEAGEPIAALYASEGSIYGRFGYGVGSYEARVSVPRGAAFLSTVELDPRPVREVSAEDAMTFVREIYPRVTEKQVGYLSRDSEHWELRLSWNRDDAGKLRYAVHPAGYALYRPKSAWTTRGPDYELRVEEIVATTPQAYAALWRYLLDMDLVTEVRWNKAAVDEPVTSMLTNPRLARREVLDGLWVRLVDVDRALEARRYRAPLDVVIEVSDAFCDWNAGRWHLRVDANGVAKVTRADEPAQLAADVSDLGAVFLGGNTIASLVRAGRIVELDEGAALRASVAFGTDHAPHCPEGF